MLLGLGVSANSTRPGLVSTDTKGLVGSDIFSPLNYVVLGTVAEDKTG